MSTYVPGVETYLPDIKPFTPDYKFLSSVLQSRQDKYNRNWQATNDLYSKIVYAPLSREDNLDKREQYIEQIKPSIEKISGLDLSIQQNVDSAKAVFAPFYEDDLLVKDMLYTTNYQNEMAYANRLFESVDKDQRSKWWETGIKDLQYKMQDFKNASGDAALAMGLPRYIEDVNLYDMAQKYLSELDPPLKMEIPINLNSNDDYIITQQNGDLVTGQALETIKNRFISDPMVQRAYYTEAFVKGRDFADQGIKSGEFSSIQEGQEIWAQQTIDLITKQNDFYKDKATKALTRESQAIDNWETYRKNNGIIPGSQDEKVMKEQYDSYEATKSSLQALRNINDVSRTPVKDLNGTLQKAYQLILMNGIGTDLTKAAKDFSMRDYSVDYEVNTVKRDRLKFQRQKDLIYLKNSLDRELAKDKGELVSPDEKNYLDFINQTQVQLGGPTGILGSIDEEGETFVRDKGLENDAVYQENENAIKAESIDAIMVGKKQFNPTGEQGKYTITLDDGTVYNGGFNEVRARLSEKDEVTGKYKNINAIQREINNYRKFTKEDKDNISEASKKFPSKMGTPEYQNFYNQLHGINSLFSRSDQNLINYNQANKQLQELNKNIIDEVIKSEDESEASLMIKAGYPSIIDENGKLSLEEYKNKSLELAKAEKLKNYKDKNLPYQTNMVKTEYLNYIDTTNEYGRPIVDRVYSDQPLPNARRSDEVKTRMITNDSGIVVPYRDRRKYDWGTLRPAYMIDERTIAKHAEKAYNVLNNKLKNNPLYKSIPSLEDARRGRSGTDDDDLSVSYEYRTTINPAAMNTSSRVAYADYITQKASLVGKGSNYGVIIGDTPSSKEDYLTKNDLALKVLKLIDDETRFVLNTDKASRTSIAKVPMFEIVQKPTFGVPSELVKDQAAITIIPNERWLKSYQKGSPDGVETGVLKNEEINSIINSGGVTLIYDKNEDVSQKATSQTYYSPLQSEIELSKYNFIEKTFPGIDSEPTATYAVTKEDNDMYFITYSLNQYQEGGTYITTPQQTKTLDFRGQSDIAARFDSFFYDILLPSFSKQQERNRQRKAKDLKLNANK